MKAEIVSFCEPSSQAQRSVMDRKSVQTALLLLIALVLRVATFGDPNMHVDETFYLLVGELMHQGALPYVDVWDRKPIGLFFIFYVFAGLPNPILAYQIGAWLSVGFTAMVINLIVRHWTGLRGGMFAGAAYIFTVAPLQGYGGQAPIFYNLLIALSALLIMKSHSSLSQGIVPTSVYFAMLLGGLAITVKQTALFEAAFFGLFVLIAIARSGAAPQRVVAVAAACAAIGAAPTLLVPGYYWIVGNWHEYWNAMIASNLKKPKPDIVTTLFRIKSVLKHLNPVLCVALLGLILPVLEKNKYRGWQFVTGWLVAATIGFLSVPNFYYHYALPLLVILCVAGASIYDRKLVGPIAIILVALWSLLWQKPWDTHHTLLSKRAMEELARSVRLHDQGHGLLIFDGPPLLYSMSGNKPMTPLTFPMHLSHALETDVSHLNTHDELARILSRKPGAVVLSVLVRLAPADWTSRAMVVNYVQKNCKLVDGQIVYDMWRKDLIAVYGDCNGPPAVKAPRDT